MLTHYGNMIIYIIMDTLRFQKVHLRLEREWINFIRQWA